MSPRRPLPRLQGLAGLLMALCVSAHAASWEDGPLPPRTQAQWALVAAVVNGVPMQAQQLHSELPVQQLLSHYENQWKRLGSVKMGRQGPWQTLSLHTDQLHLVLQAQADGAGSRGLLSQAQWRDVRRDFMPVEMPAALRTQVNQVTETRDGPRRSRLVTAACPDGFEITRQRMVAHARSKGWTVVTDQVLRKDGARHWLAAYDAMGLSVDVVLTQADGASASHLTLNFTDSPT
ncbi:hypothetical protein QRD43_05370 [Pelomonas sp. APW6]|uniref:Uncharacterized protein n=1 Tax=Roseateles subflavus TaxID=3053353 RepID=A0ABT7LER0_9BURK|nr:hypothetical protein [Pelomonas sp. APW6]MDL5031333.1 hypothetical protein [Pelomonas sp. APW6]